MLTNTPDGVVIRLIIVVRVPIVLVRVPRVLGIVTVRSTRPVIVSRYQLTAVNSYLNLGGRIAFDLLELSFVSIKLCCNL